VGVAVVARRSLLLEVVVVLFECAAGVQQGLVSDRDGGKVADAEVDTCHPVAGRVRIASVDATDDVQLPLLTGPDRSDLLDVLYVHIRAGGVLAENEVRPRLFEIRSFRESNPVVVGVVFETVLFECDRRAGMLVALLAVAGWVRVPVAILTVGVPRVERFSQFFENCLTGLSVQIRVAFVTLEVRFERAVVWNRAGFTPDTVAGPPGDVPEFRGGEPKRIEVVAHLLVVANGRNVGARDQIRHT